MLRDELLAVMRRQPKIREIQFGPHTPPETRSQLADILAENHPLMGILRILDGSRVATFVIEGVKTVNDALSQQTADVLLGVVRDKVQKRLQERFGAEFNLRVVGKDHKKLVFSIPGNATQPLPSRKELDAIIAETVREEAQFIA